MNDQNLFIPILLGVCTVILLFIVFRQVICWYYKINERLAAAEKTNFLLEKLLDYYQIDYKSTAQTEVTYTVKHIESNKVSTVNQKTWDAMKKNYGVDAYEVISYK